MRDCLKYPLQAQGKINIAGDIAEIVFDGGDGDITKCNVNTKMKWKIERLYQKLYTKSPPKNV